MRTTAQKIYRRQLSTAVRVVLQSQASTCLRGWGDSWGGLGSGDGSPPAGSGGTAVVGDLGEVPQNMPKQLVTELMQVPRVE